MLHPPPSSAAGLINLHHLNNARPFSRLKSKGPGVIQGLVTPATAELDWLIGLLPTGKRLVHVLQPGVIVKVQVDSLDQLGKWSTAPADY